MESARKRLQSESTRMSEPDVRRMSKRSAAWRRCRPQAPRRFFSEPNKSWINLSGDTSASNNQSAIRQREIFAVTVPSVPSTYQA